MIPCQVCNHDNALGTVYCHSCGTKLVVDFAAIERSVAGSVKVEQDHAMLRSGRSSLALCGFALVCALVARYVVVPPMPPAILPPTPLMELFSEQAASPPAP
jgi:hypothetical protein